MEICVFDKQSLGPSHCEPLCMLFLLVAIDLLWHFKRDESWNEGRYDHANSQWILSPLKSLETKLGCLSNFFLYHIEEMPTLVKLKSSRKVLTCFGLTTFSEGSFQGWFAFFSSKVASTSIFIFLACPCSWLFFFSNRWSSEPFVLGFLPKVVTPGFLLGSSSPMSPSLATVRWDLKVERRWWSSVVHGQESTVERQGDSWDRAMADFCQASSHQATTWSRVTLALLRLPRRSMTLEPTSLA